MNKPLGGKRPSAAKEIAYIAIMTALLIGGQLVFSFVVGVEIVTLLLVCFAYVFGVKDGVITAVAFSLLRCFLWGFYPTVIILYLVYYPLLAALFGAMGHVKSEFYLKPKIWFAVILNAVLWAVIVFCALCINFNFIKVSRLYLPRLKAFLIVIICLCGALALLFDGAFILKRTGVIKSGDMFKVVTCTTTAAFCTVCFTLLDDVITPLVLGMTAQTALAYFYSSFIAMLPQTVCTIATVSTLFLPVTRIFEQVKRK